MKRTLRILGITLLCLAALAGIVLATFSSSKVQTAMARFVMSQISKDLQNNMNVERISLKFPADIDIQGIYIEDQQHDTLLYVHNLDARFHPLALLRRNHLRFSQIIVDGTFINAYMLPDSTYNFQFLIQGDSTQQDSSQPFSQTIQTDKTIIQNTRVRFDDYRLSMPHISMQITCLAQDTLDAEIDELRAAINHHDTLFEINGFQGHALAGNNTLMFPTLSLQLPHSTLDLSGIYWTKDEAFLHINQADITPSDLMLFVPQVGHINGIATITADMYGTNDSINASNLSLSYNNERIIVGDIALGGIEQDSLYFHANCQDLALNAAQLQDFISEMNNRPFHLPKNVYTLGNVHYQGRLQGTLNHLTLHGAFRTALGGISTDGHLDNDTALNTIHFDGHLASRRFLVGRLAGIRDLGTIAFDIEGKGSSYDNGFPQGTAKATIHKVTYRDYTYCDIVLDGSFAKDVYDGTLAIEDPNLQVHFNGLADLTKAATQLRFHLDIPHFAPGPLNLSDKYADAIVSLRSQVDVSGLDPNHLNGYWVIDSLKMSHAGENVMMKQLLLEAQSGRSTASNAKKTLKLTGDYFTACASGKFDYATLSTSLMKQVERYLPSLFSHDKRAELRKATPHNVFDFYFYGRELRAIQRVLDLPIRLSDYPVLKGYINDNSKALGLQAYIPYLRSRETRADNITLAMDNSTSDYLNLDVSTTINEVNCTLHSYARADSIFTHLVADDPLPPTNSCNVRFDTKLNQYANKPLISMQIQPSTFMIADSTYHIEPSEFAYCAADTSLIISQFRVSSGEQFIEAEGIASTKTSDSLTIHLGKIEAGYLLPFVLPEKTLTVQGELSGWAHAFAVFSAPVFDADLRLDSAGLNGAYFGDATARVNLCHETGNISIDADVIDNGHKVAHVDGLVEPSEKAWLIDIHPDSISLAFINHWTHGIMEDIDGRGYGEVKVFGRDKNTWVNAAVYAKEAGITIPYTGCRYTFSDSAYLDSFAIRFPDIDLRDSEGNRLLLNGLLTHRNFMNFQYDISIRPTNALAFDLPNQKGEMLSGKVYATGNVEIHGNDNECRLNVEATTVGKSRFRFSIDGPGNAQQNNFLSFVDHDAPPSDTIQLDADFGDVLHLKKKTNFPGTRFILAMNIDATPALNFELMLNERTGDMIQARGEGGLRMVYNDKTGDVNLFGTYTIQSGSLGFTVANLIRRDFTINEGSQIIWSGRAEQPTLDVTAKYRVTASLKDLFGEEINTLTSSRTSVPVNTLISLSGTLDNPIIRFGLELPMSEDAIRQQVLSIINTDEMMMRQVAYLLVFGRFFTPEYMRSTSVTGVNEMYSVLSSTLTGQINSWIGKLTDAFTMGFDVRTDDVVGDGSTEYEAKLQWQPVDRLLINGNIGYRYNDITNRPFFGDVDIEYMLTPNGKFRLKGYTHTVDKYSLRQASTIQGVGFVFKHDFNWQKTPTKTTRKNKR